MSNPTIEVMYTELSHKIFWNIHRLTYDNEIVAPPLLPAYVTQFYKLKMRLL